MSCMVRCSTAAEMQNLMKKAAAAAMWGTTFIVANVVMRVIMTADSSSQ